MLIYERISAYNRMQAYSHGGKHENNTDLAGDTPYRFDLT